MGFDAQVLLAQARQLESQIQQAAFEMLREDGSYEQSQQLLLVASDVRKLASRLEEVATGRVKPSVHTSASAQTPTASQRARKAASTKYPIFYVADGRLIKIGKGKQKSAKEYRHEAPRRSFDAVARWIEETTLSGAREWFARTADEQLSDQVPTYQVYLIIAALQKAGVVRSVRRGWYALDSAAGSPEDWWSRLEDLSDQRTIGGDQ
jgi:hypothetical protein